MWKVCVACVVVVGGSILLGLGDYYARVHQIEPAMPLLAGAVACSIMALICWSVVRHMRILDKLDYISICLNTAETEMNNLIMRGYDASGRKTKCEEKQGWAKLIPAHPLAFAHAEYHSSFDTVYASYEADFVGVKTDKRLINQTAMLLRDVYSGSILSAQIRIVNHFRENEKLPYVASGVAELVHLWSFDKKAGHFKRPGEDCDLVKRAIKDGGYPRNLLLFDGKNAWRGADVLDKLTRH